MESMRETFGNIMLQLLDMRDRAKVEKDNCVQQYKDSMNLPRKKKKKARNKILQMYSIWHHALKMYE